MRIAVTGALGHIGSGFIHSLQQGDFDDVLLIDNLASLRYGSMFNLPPNVPFRFAEADVCRAPLTKLFSGIDAVVHLAAITDAASSFGKKDEVEQVNLDGARKVGEACASRGSRLIFASTTSVYGSTDGQVDETTPFADMAPQSPYAETKLKAEQAIGELGSTAGLCFSICRFGTIFGPSQGMRFHTAVNKFIWQACTGQPLTVWRNGLTERRPHLDLEDAVRGVRFVLSNRAADNQTFNLVTENVLLQDIIDRIRDEIPTVQLRFVEAAILNQRSCVVSSQRFESLGFKFEGDLKRAVRRTMALLSRS